MPLALQQEVILITGGNAGLGKETAKRLAGQGASHIWIAARDQKRTIAAIHEIKQASSVTNIEVKFLQLDLTSFESIKTAAETFNNAVTRLDRLILNAGIMACPPGLTKEGYEIQFGTNHMGHALLVKLLMPLLSRTATEHSVVPRIIAISSVAHKFAPAQGISFETLKTNAANLSTDKRYAQSKLANILFIRQLAKRHPEILAVAIHPGTVKTDLQNSNDGSLLLQFFSKMCCATDWGECGGGRKESDLGSNGFWG